MACRRKPAPPQRPPSAEERALVEKYRSLVNRIVGGVVRRVPPNVLREDLFAAGMGGLWDAIRRRKSDIAPEAFEWYASTRIRGAIHDELRAQDWLPRRARAAAKTLYSNHAARPRCVLSLSDATAAELEQALAIMFDDEARDREQVSRILRAAVDRLPERERDVIHRHFLEGVKSKDLAEECGLTQPRISQILHQALDRLRDGALRADLAES